MKSLGLKPINRPGANQSQKSSNIFRVNHFSKNSWTKTRFLRYLRTLPTYNFWHYESRYKLWSVQILDID